VVADWRTTGHESSRETHPKGMPEIMILAPIVRVQSQIEVLSTPNRGCCDPVPYADATITLRDQAIAIGTESNCAARVFERGQFPVVTTVPDSHRAVLAGRRQSRPIGMVRDTQDGFGMPLDGKQLKPFGSIPDLDRLVETGRG
jgi:hypothetical protein